jgi:hypothetical protein
MYFRDRPTVTKHLLSAEFCRNYMHWSEHGEDNPSGLSSSTSNKNQQCMQAMLMNVMGPDFNWDEHDFQQQPNSMAAKFFSMLAANEEPL